MSPSNNNNNNNDNSKNVPWIEVDLVMTDHGNIGSANEEMTALTGNRNDSSDEEITVTAERIGAQTKDGSPSDIAAAVTSDTDADNATVPCDQARVAASGTAGCILGCIVGGPVLAVVSALGLAYASSHNEGPMGNMARAMGDVALATQAKAVEVNNKYDVATKAKSAATNAWETAEKLEREHRICQRSGRAAVKGSKAVLEYSKKHRLVERSAEGCTTCLQSMANQINASTDNSSTAVAPRSHIIVRDGAVSVSIDGQAGGTAVGA